MDESSYSEFHYGAIYSFQKSEHNGKQRAHGNIYNTPGVCGRSCHLIKESAGTIQVVGQASEHRVLTKARRNQEERKERAREKERAAIV